MATIAEQRAAVAAALSGVTELDVRPAGPVKSPKAGDGWVVVGDVTPAGYRSWDAPLTGLVVLGSDLVKAEALADEWTLPALAALDSAADLLFSDLTARREQLSAGEASAGALFVLTISLTVEVSL